MCVCVCQIISEIATDGTGTHEGPVTDGPATDRPSRDDNSLK